MNYKPPTPDEMKRVAEYWRRVEALTCDHTSLTVMNAEAGFSCGDKCGRPIRILSDIQIEEMKKPKAMPDNVRDDIIAQLKRGGVCFTTDGQRYDVRLHAHRYPGSDEECVCIEVENVALMMRASEGR